MRQLYELHQQRSDVSSLIRTDTTPPTVVEYMVSRFSRDSMILEVGSGGGHLAARLAAEGFTHVICSEFTSTAVSFMRERGLPVVLCLDATRLPFVDAALDVVISVEVLEHLPDVRCHIREVARVLRPGGGYLIKTPNKLVASLYYRFAGHHDIDIWHPSTLRPGELRRMLEAEGLAPRYLPAPLSGSQLRKVPGGPLLRGLAGLVPWSIIPAAIRPSLLCIALKQA